MFFAKPNTSLISASLAANNDVKHAALGKPLGSLWLLVVLGAVQAFGVELHTNTNNQALLLLLLLTMWMLCFSSKKVSLNCALQCMVQLRDTKLCTA